MVLAHTNFMGGGHTLAMFIPFGFILGGLGFIAFAARDDRKRARGRSVRVLPVGSQHPLSHLRSKLKPPAPAVRPQRSKPAGARHRTEPPWLKKVV